MVKSTIESKGIASTKENEKMKNDQIRSYLKALEKKSLRSGRKDSAEGKVKEQEEVITGLEDEITNLKQEGNSIQI